MELFRSILRLTKFHMRNYKVPPIPISQRRYSRIWPALSRKMGQALER